MYPTSDSFVTGTSGGAFGTPSSVTYSAAGVTTPLAQNLYVTDNVVYFNDVSKVVTESTKVITINGEKIRFTTVDYVANTVSGLTRGIEGTGIVTLHTQNSYVYGLSVEKQLDSQYYYRSWNTKNYTTRGDPLQLSNSYPVRFLELGIN